jgi:hypothetical protein
MQLFVACPYLAISSLNSTWQIFEKIRLYIHDSVAIIFGTSYLLKKDEFELNVLRQT